MCPCSRSLTTHKVDGYSLSPSLCTVLVCPTLFMFWCFLCSKPKYAAYVHWLAYWSCYSWSWFFFAIFRVVARVTWLVQALVVFLDVFGRLTGFTFFLPRLSILSVLLLLLSPSHHLLSGNHRLCHLCGPCLSTLICRGLLGSVLGHESLEYCQGCRLGRHIQLPYHSSESVSMHPLILCTQMYVVHLPLFQRKAFDIIYFL